MSKSLEIAIDMLDRVEGTALYDVQKKIMGWTDKEYQTMIESLSLLYIYLNSKDSP
jgi:hypothetical protein